MTPKPTFLQVKFGLIPLIHYVHCNLLHTHIQGPSKQTNLGKVGAESGVKSQQGGQ